MSFSLFFGHPLPPRSRYATPRAHLRCSSLPWPSRLESGATRSDESARSEGASEFSREERGVGIESDFGSAQETTLEFFSDGNDEGQRFSTDVDFNHVQFSAFKRCFSFRSSPIEFSERRNCSLLDIDPYRYAAAPPGLHARVGQAQEELDVDVGCRPHPGAAAKAPRAGAAAAAPALAGCGPDRPRGRRGRRQRLRHRAGRQREWSKRAREAFAAKPPAKLHHRSVLFFSNRLSPCSPELHFVLTSLSLRHTQPA